MGDFPSRRGAPGEVRPREIKTPEKSKSRPRHLTGLKKEEVPRSIPLLQKNPKINSVVAHKFQKCIFWLQRPYRAHTEPIINLSCLEITRVCGLWSKPSKHYCYIVIICFFFNSNVIAFCFTTLKERGMKSIKFIPPAFVSFQYILMWDIAFL